MNERMFEIYVYISAMGGALLGVPLGHIAAVEGSTILDADLAAVGIIVVIMMSFKIIDRIFDNIEEMYIND